MTCTVNLSARARLGFEPTIRKSLSNSSIFLEVEDEEGYGDEYEDEGSEEAEGLDFGDVETKKEEIVEDDEKNNAEVKLETPEPSSQGDQVEQKETSKERKEPNGDILIILQDKGDTKSEDPAENDKGTGDQPDDTGKSKATDKKLLGQLVDALKGKLQSRSRNTGQQSVNPKPRGTNQVVRELNGIPAKNEGHQMSEKSDGGNVLTTHIIVSNVKSGHLKSENRNVFGRGRSLGRSYTING